MPWVNKQYKPAHVFMAEYAAGQKKIRADYMDEQFSDLSSVLTNFFTDIDELKDEATSQAEIATTKAEEAAASAAAASTAGAEAGTAAANAVTDAMQDDINTLLEADPQNVKITGNQTIGGTKTFSSPAILPTSFGKPVALSLGAIDVSKGAAFTKTITANTTFSITGVPNDTVACFALILTNAGAYTITWPTGTKWEDGYPPSFTKDGIDIIMFLTPDGGTSWHATVPTRDSI